MYRVKVQRIEKKKKKKEGFLEEIGAGPRGILKEQKNLFKKLQAQILLLFDFSSYIAT